MLDDCLREENYVRQEYDSIYIMMGTNDIRRSKDGMRAAKKLTRIVKETRKKTQTNIKILEIAPFGNYNHQKERNLFYLAIKQGRLNHSNYSKRNEDLPTWQHSERRRLSCHTSDRKIMANSINKAPPPHPHPPPPPPPQKKNKKK